MQIKATYNTQVQYFNFETASVTVDFDNTKASITTLDQRPETTLYFDIDANNSDQSEALFHAVVDHSKSFFEVWGSITALSKLLATHLPIFQTHITELLYFKGAETNLYRYITDQIQDLASRGLMQNLSISYLNSNCSDLYSFPITLEHWMEKFATVYDLLDIKNPHNTKVIKFQAAYGRRPFQIYHQHRTTQYAILNTNLTLNKAFEEAVITFGSVSKCFYGVVLGKNASANTVESCFLPIEILNLIFQHYKFVSLPKAYQGNLQSVIEITDKHLKLVRSVNQYKKSSIIKTTLLKLSPRLTPVLIHSAHRGITDDRNVSDLLKAYGKDIAKLVIKCVLGFAVASILSYLSTLTALYSIHLGICAIAALSLNAIAFSRCEFHSMKVDKLNCEVYYPVLIPNDAYLRNPFLNVTLMLLSAFYIQSLPIIFAAIIIGADTWETSNLTTFLKNYADVADLSSGGRLNSVLTCTKYLAAGILNIAVATAVFI